MESTKISHGISWTVKKYLTEYHGIYKNISWNIMYRQKISHGISWNLQKYLMEYHEPSKNISWNIMESTKNISWNIIDLYKISHGISWNLQKYLMEDHGTLKISHENSLTNGLILLVNNASISEMHWVLNHFPCVFDQIIHKLKKSLWYYRIQKILFYSN